MSYSSFEMYLYILMIPFVYHALFCKINFHRNYFFIAHIMYKFKLSKPFLQKSFVKVEIISHFKKITKMKKLLIPLVIITSVIITYVSCKKSDQQSLAPNEFDVASAKEWFYGSFKKSPEYTHIHNSIPSPLLLVCTITLINKIKHLCKNTPTGNMA